MQGQAVQEKDTRARKAAAQLLADFAPQDAVVHVADVSPDAQAFLHEAIEPAQVEIGEVLRCQAADRQPTGGRGLKPAMIRLSRSSRRLSLNSLSSRSPGSECGTLAKYLRMSSLRKNGKRAAYDRDAQGGQSALAAAARKGVGDEPTLKNGLTDVDDRVVRAPARESTAP